MSTPRDDYDLIELLVYGGPWTEDEAYKQGSEIIALIRDRIGLRLTVHVADVRSESEGAEE